MTTQTQTAAQTAAQIEAWGASHGIAWGQPGAVDAAIAADEVDAYAADGFMSANPLGPRRPAAAVETQALFSRAIPFSEATAQPGDQINTTPDGFRPHWQTLVGVVQCTDESDRGEHDCDGGCAMVLQLEPVEEYDATFWHVDWADYASILTRLPVGGVK